VNDALTLDPRLSRKGRGFNRDIEVRLAAPVGVCASVTGMTRGIIYDLQVCRLKRSDYFLSDALAIYRHFLVP